MHKPKTTQPAKYLRLIRWVCEVLTCSAWYLLRVLIVQISVIDLLTTYTLTPDHHDQWQIQKFWKRGPSGGQCISTNVICIPHTCMHACTCCRCGTCTVSTFRTTQICDVFSPTMALRVTRFEKTSHLSATRRYLHAYNKMCLFFYKWRWLVLDLWVTGKLLFEARLTESHDKVTRNMTTFQCLRQNKIIVYFLFC